MNSNRYTTSKHKYMVVKNEEIKSLLAIKPPFDIYTGKSYFTLSKRKCYIKRQSKRILSLYL